MVCKTMRMVSSIGMLVLSVIFTLSSCNSENDKVVEEEGNDQIIDRVIEANEYMEFRVSCMALAEKLKSYTSTLSLEEFDELMSNLNNDDYMAELVGKIDVKNELLMVESTKETLLNYADFQQLDASERMNLFVRSSDNALNMMVKTRSEGGAADECERRRNEDYSYASSIYVSAMLACSCATGGIGVCLCAVAASAAYEYAITLADRSFADCLKNAK